MNFAASISTTSALFSIGLAVMAWRVARAPGWEALRWFALVALMAAAYALGNIATTTGGGDGFVLFASRVQLAACMVQSFAWFEVVDAQVGRQPGRRERWLRWLLAAGGAACLIPGVAYGGAVTSHVFAPWNATYRDAVPTAYGATCFALTLSTGVLLLARIARAWRRGLRQALLQFLAVASIFALGVNDALAASGVTSAPYLLDVGFLAPVATLAWVYANRFVRDAEALMRLRSRLESLVEERTRDLVATQGMLHQAEKLAALGQFAAGVAHEVNNPAAVVTANLRFLGELAAADGAPEEARVTIDESLAAMQRINVLVRRLVDAGRLAASPAARGNCAVRGVITQALDEARAQTGERVTWAPEVPPDLFAAVRGEVLHQVLAALLANASQAIPPSRTGRVDVSAAVTEDGQVAVTIRDDGIGMSADVLRRAFEPFFTTRAAGQGSGLGLPVARALIESHGGALRLETAPDRGTAAVLTVPLAHPT